MRNRASAAFPQWTDFGPGNFGNILLELFAQTLDVASFYQDQQFKETRVVWAQLLSSMIQLGKNLGFTLPAASVATTTLNYVFADGNPRVGDVVIPTGTFVQTLDGTVTFVTTAAGTIPAGQVEVDSVPAQNAFSHVDSFTTTGLPGYQFTLSASPYVDSSAVVVIASQSYSQAPNNAFYTSLPTDRVYVVSTDQNGVATLTFGDGTNGIVPTGSGTASYLTGGGSAGNVEADQLEVFPSGSVFSSTRGEQVVVTVRNPAQAAGGVDAMTVEEARVAIPASVRTAGLRSVTNQDFVDNAEKVRGVARAMLLTADNSNLVPENTGWLYILPVGGGLPTTQLEDQVLAFILSTYPPTLTFTLLMKNPTLTSVSVNARVSLERGISHSDARTAVTTALANYFSLLLPSGAPNPLVDFGYNIRTNVMPPGSTQAVVPFSDVFSVVSEALDVAGNRVFREVDKASFSPGADVPVADTSFPILGSISLFDIDLNVSF